MEQHTLELSKSLSPTFDLANLGHQNDSSISMLELSMLSGTTVHLMLTISVGSEGTSVRMEWLQKYPV